MACRGNYNTTHCCSNGFTGETTTLHPVAAMVLQGRLQHYTLLQQWFYRGDYNTTPCCSSGFTGESAILHTQCCSTCYTGKTTTLYDVAAVVLQGRLQHYTMLLQWFYRGDYNTTQCHSSGFTRENTTLHNVATVVYTEGRLQHYTMLQQWFAHFCSSSLQGRLQRENTKLHTVAAVVCMEDYDTTTYCCSNAFRGETTTDCTVSQLWFAGKTTTLHTVAAVV